MSLRRSLILLLIPLSFSACWLTDKEKDRKVSSDMINEPGSDENGEKPELSFDRTVHKFGTISQGETVETEFIFENSGDAPLVIASVEPSCGCTVMDDAPEEPFYPGEGDTLNVTYDSKGHTGHQDRTVSVVANTDPQTTLLHIQGTVKGPR